MWWLTGPTFVETVLAKAGVHGGCAEGEEAGGGGGGQPAGQPAGGADPGEGGGGESKSFTQDEVNRIVESRLAKERKNLPDIESLKQKAEQADTLQQKLEELQEQVEGKDKPEHQREMERLQKRVATFEKQLQDKEKALQERDQALEQERGHLRETVVRHQLSGALTSAKVHPDALEDALSSMLSLAGDDGIELDDDGKITGIHIGDQLFKSPKEAATQFLEIKPHFAAAVVGGSGQRRPGGKAPKDLSKMNAQQLIKSGLRDRMGRG